MTTPAHQFSTQIIRPAGLDELFDSANLLPSAVAGYRADRVTTATWPDEFGTNNLTVFDRSSISLDDITIQASTLDALNHNGSSQYATSSTNTPAVQSWGAFNWFESVFVPTDSSDGRTIWTQSNDVSGNATSLFLGKSSNPSRGWFLIHRIDGVGSQAFDDNLISLNSYITSGEPLHIIGQLTSTGAWKLCIDGTIVTLTPVVQHTTTTTYNRFLIGAADAFGNPVTNYYDDKISYNIFGSASGLLTDSQMLDRYDRLHHQLVDIRGGQNLRSVKAFSAPTVGQVASVQLDGASQAVHGHSQSLQDEFTVQLIVYGSEAPAGVESVLRQGSFELTRQADNTILVVFEATTYINGTINLDKAVNVIAVKQTAGGDLSLFVGDQQDGSAVSASMTMEDEPLQLGNVSGGTTDREALIEIWDTALSDDEIKGLARAALQSETYSGDGLGLGI